MSSVADTTGILEGATARSVSVLGRPGYCVEEEPGRGAPVRFAAPSCTREVGHHTRSYNADGFTCFGMPLALFRQWSQDHA